MLPCCVVNGQGKIEREAKVASEPEALIAWFAALEIPLARIGLEARPLSQWLFAALQASVLAVEHLETRHIARRSIGMRRRIASPRNAPERFFRCLTRMFPLRPFSWLLS